MKVRNLDTFYWIASLGSFRAASEKLNLTQPAISARIQVLEQDLGTEVFVREVRNAELTAEGRKLFQYAERLMNLEQDILSAFVETTTVEQTIRVGASETIVSTWLPELKPVSLQLAKDQRLSLNPAQISGCCGRLMCCLMYEHRTYVESRRRFPREGKSLRTSKGRETVIAIDILRETVTVRGESGERRTLELDDLKREVADTPRPPR